MKIIKCISVSLIVLSAVAALTSMTGVSLLSAEDFASREQVAYESLGEPQNYDPDKFALDANRGELRKEYFGIKLADLKTDSNGHFVMTEEQRDLFIRNILGKHMCSLQWISWKQFGSVIISQDSDTGIVFIKGGQKSKTNSDYLEIDGTLTVISPLHLRFEGEITTVIVFLFAITAGKGLLEHIGTDQSQQHKGNPVVEGLNGIGKESSQKEANQRHQGLKTAKPDATGGHSLSVGLFHAKALAHGHSKGIHAQAHCQKQQLHKTHKKTSVPFQRGSTP